MQVEFSQIYLVRLDIFVDAFDVILQVLKTFESFLTSFTNNDFRFESADKIVAWKAIVSQQTLLKAESWFAVLFGFIENISTSE